MIEEIGVAPRDEDVLLREHDAFGPAGRARGVEDDTDVAAPAGGYPVEPRLADGRIGLQRLAPRLLHALDGDEIIGIVFLEAARVVVDDLADRADVGGDGEHLVRLLLILDDGVLHLGVREDVSHLLGNGVLIDGNGDRAEALRRAEGPVEVGPVIADDRDRLAGFQAEQLEADRKGLDLALRLGPGPRLPDAEGLLAEGRARAIALRIVQKQFRNGVERGRRRVSRRNCGVHRNRLLPSIARPLYRDF